MASIHEYPRLVGSRRATPPGERVGVPDPHEQVEITIYLRPRKRLPSLERIVTLPIRQREVLSREEFVAAHGANPKDVAAIETFARTHRFRIIEVDAARRCVVLSGAVVALQAAFRVDLARYKHPSGMFFRGRTGPIRLPSGLVPIVDGVFGLDDRPQVDLASHQQIARRFGRSYSVPEIARIYNFPTECDGRGQCIALLEPGGGFRQTDFKTYFERRRLSPPQISSVSVDRVHNHPTKVILSRLTPSALVDIEVALDVEVAGAVAPGARIAVYFTPMSDRGLIDAVTTATHDRVHSPTVISISWSTPELSVTGQARRVLGRALHEAAALGVTVCCSSGDFGSRAEKGAGDGRPHVKFPASHPLVLACGGTQLEWSANRIRREVVWNEQARGYASGGGVSELYERPPWQKNAHVPLAPGRRRGRGVPDVAGNAPGYRILVDGHRLVRGGTSAVAPLWGGLIALINQRLGVPVGFVNPLLYDQLGTRAFRDITRGSNGAYRARKGWDACTGLGCPDGTMVMAALAQ
jgi:kumamolisin